MSTHPPHRRRSTSPRTGSTPSPRPRGEHPGSPTTAAGFRKLIAWIGSGIGRIAYEPTGAFHRDFEDTLLKAGLPLYAINPFQVRSFARSIGRRAKTDAVDARLLATMASPPNSKTCARPRRDRRGSATSPSSSRSAIASGQGSNRNHQPGQELAHSRGQAGHQAEAEADRPPAEAHRCRDPAADRGGEGNGAPGRDPDLDPGHLGHHRIAGLIVHLPELGMLTRVANSRQPRRTRPGHPGVRKLEGTELHPGRQAPGPHTALHARGGRGPAQSRPQAQVRGARRRTGASRRRSP